MTLPTSGTITAADINVELGRPIHNPLDLNDPEARALAGVPSGCIRYSDFYGKSNNPFISEGWYDSSQPLNLSPECNRIYFEMVAGGGGGGGGFGYYSPDIGAGAGGGGAGQFKSGYINVTNRNLYLVVGARGNRGRGGYCAGNNTNTGEVGGNGGNSDIRVGSASGTVLAWCQGGQGGKVTNNANSAAGGNDGDGNAGGAGVPDNNAGINGNNGSGRAGGSGGNYAGKGGNGGQAGNNGGGYGVAVPPNQGMGACGGGGGRSAAPWGGTPGKGGAASIRAIWGHYWSLEKATSATGYGHGGGGGHKSANYTDMANADAGSGGYGSQGRIYIKQLRK